jgi:heme oxygenase
MTSTTASAVGAAARLRHATREAHGLAEAEPFVVGPVGGRRDAAAYARLARLLRVVHDAFEAEVAVARTIAPAGPASLLDPRLDRVPALDIDLRALASGEAAALIRPLPAIAAMLRRHDGHPDEALTYSTFDGISEGASGARHREVLDAILADEAAYAETLAETHAAYAANRSLFTARDAAG